MERMGTGILDMITRCREAGLPEPQFAVTDGFVITLRRRQQRALEAVTQQVPSKVLRKYSSYSKHCTKGSSHARGCRLQWELGIGSIFAGNTLRHCFPLTCWSGPSQTNHVAAGKSTR